MDDSKLTEEELRNKTKIGKAVNQNIRVESGLGTRARISLKNYNVYWNKKTHETQWRI
jgi:L-ribulose-5-phosphate 3-epimerase UlaE